MTLEQAVMIVRELGSFGVIIWLVVIQQIRHERVLNKLVSAINRLALIIHGDGNEEEDIEDE